MLVNFAGVETVTQETIGDHVKSKFNFNVQKFPLSGPDGLTTKRDDGCLYGLFRDDTGQRVGNSSVKKRYVPHTKEHITDLAIAASHVFDGEIEVKTYFKDGHFINMRPKKGDILNLHANEQLCPLFFIKASFDGKAASATLGLYNVLCNNCEMFDSVTDSKVSIGHTSAIHFKMDKLIKTMETLQEKWCNVEMMIEHMQGKTTHVQTFLDELYQKDKIKPDSKRGQTTFDNRNNAIKARLRKECQAVGETYQGFVNNWRLYNAIQGYYQHDSSRNEKTTDFDAMLSSNESPIIKKAQKLLCISA